jgi:hypothetical protein
MENDSSNSKAGTPVGSSLKKSFKPTYDFTVGDSTTLAVSEVPAAPVVPLSPPVSSPIRDIFLKGSQVLTTTEVGFLEAGKGVFRGGSGGLWLSPDTVVNCQRKAILRFHGIELDDGETDEGLVGQGKDLMFQAGHTNEDSWLKVLAQGFDGGIRREEEIPIIWDGQTSTGKPWTVTGRPDMVLGETVQKEFSPTIGIELKLVCSAWVAAKVLMNKPKVDNLRQAALYSWRLSEQYGHDVPFELWYTSRVNFAVMGDWMAKLFPKEGDPGSELCSYKDAKLQDGTPVRQLKGTTPFIKGFQLRWTSHGRLQFLPIQTAGAEWTDTIVTKASIMEFYNKMQEAMETDLLPPRPAPLDFQGQKDFDICSYCPLASKCDTLESSKETRLSSFINAATTHVNL